MINIVFGEIRSDIFYLGGLDILFADQTVRHNLNFWAKIYGSETNIQAALRTFSIENISNRKISEI